MLDFLYVNNEGNQQTIINNTLNTINIDETSINKGAFFNGNKSDLNRFNDFNDFNDIGFLDKDITIHKNVFNKNTLNENTDLTKKFVVGDEADKFNVLAEWVGVVTEIHNSYFIATVKDMTNDLIQEEVVEFNIDDLTKSQLEKLSIASMFYWTIGYKIFKKTKYKTSKIAFRHLRPLSKPLIKLAEKEALQLDDFFAQFNK